MQSTLQTNIESAWKDRTLLQSSPYQEAVADVMGGLDNGTLRVAEPLGNGEWQVNEWVKQAVLMNLQFSRCKPSRLALSSSMTKCR